MKSRDWVPIYLHETYDMLKCAYPEGIPEEEYWSVMALIHPYVSYRSIPPVFAALMDKDESLFVNDAMGFPAPYDPMPDPADLEKVKQKLDACDYAAWVAKNTF